LGVLQALPLCNQTAELRLKSKFKNAPVGYASIPRARSPSDKETAEVELKHPNVPTKVQVALGSIAPSGLVIDYFATLNSSFHPTIFKSDVTYFVAGPYYCNGPVVLEAACFKFPYYSGSSNPNLHPTTAFISFNNSVTCKTSEYFPAVCTAADDETWGESVGGYSIWPDWSGIVQGYYGSPCFLINSSSASISNVFFHYAAEAIRFDGSSAAGGTAYTLADAQIVSCQKGITMSGTLPAQSGGGGEAAIPRRRNPGLLANLFAWAGGVAYCDAPPPQPGQPYNIDINNCLLVTNQNPITITVPVNAHFNHCTFDQNQVASPGPLVSSTIPTWVTTPYASFVNCIFANLPAQSSGLVTLGGNKNGFYNSFGNGNFGDNPVPASGYPFQAPAPGYGAYYLADPNFRNAGTALLSPGILNDLKTRSVDPPDWIDGNLPVTSQLTLMPHVYRYATGDSPHLGYWYAALDYVYGKVVVDSGAADTIARVVIEPGTAIAINAPDQNTDWSFGFVLAGNSSVVAHGNPTNPITITTVELVQEGQFSQGPSFAFVPAWWYEFSLDDYYTLMPPSLSFRFCNFYFPHLGFPVCSGQDASGVLLPGDPPISLGSTMRFSLQDCAVHGGGIAIEEPIFDAQNSGSGYPHLAPGSFSCVNNFFDRVGVFLHPTAYSAHSVDQSVVRQMDFSVEAYNNLFRGGWLSLEPAPSSHGDWTIRDNMFDKVSFVLLGDRPLPLDHDYNAYLLWEETLEDQQDPEYPATGQVKRLAVDTGQANGAPHDVVFNSAPAYQNGTFGGFYLASSARTVNTGSRSPSDAQLFQYTTRTDDVKEGEETGPAKVNIGLHYVAAADGAPKSTLLVGVPDYVADADGNGLTDATEFNLPPTTYLNQKLKANNDYFQLSPDGKLVVEINDVDSSGQPMTLVYPPSATTTVETPHGHIEADPLFQKVVYTPNSGYSGVDTFTYAIVNDYNQESSATNKVFVNQAGNHPPQAVDHNLSMNPGDQITIHLLTGCTDSDGDTLKVDSVTPPLYGSVRNIQFAGH
jgi:hypothetical protein